MPFTSLCLRDRSLPLLPANGPWPPFCSKERWLLLLCAVSERVAAVTQAEKKPCFETSMLFLSCYRPSELCCAVVLGRLSKPPNAGLTASDSLQTPSASGALGFNYSFTSRAVEIYVWLFSSWNGDRQRNARYHNLLKNLSTLLLRLP